MSLHQQATRIVAPLHSHQTGVDKIDRPDIERRRHGNLALLADQSIDKIETGLTVIQTSVDMSLLDIKQTARTHNAGITDQQGHGHFDGRALLAGQH